MRICFARKYLFWIVSLLVLSGLTVSCVKKPLKTQTTVLSSGITSQLFKVEGLVQDKAFHSVRAYLHVGADNDFMLNLLSAMNSPIMAIYFDGVICKLVDYQNKSVYIDRTPPFDFKGILPFRVDLLQLAGFYRKTHEIDGSFRQVFQWGTLLQTANGRIVGLMNDRSRFMMTPIGPPRLNVMKALKLPVPSGYKTYYEKH